MQNLSSPSLYKKRYFHTVRPHRQLVAAYHQHGRSVRKQKGTTNNRGYKWLPPLSACV